MSYNHQPLSDEERQAILAKYGVSSAEELAEKLFGKPTFTKEAALAMVDKYFPLPPPRKPIGFWEWFFRDGPVVPATSGYP